MKRMTREQENKLFGPKDHEAPIVQTPIVIVNRVPELLEALKLAAAYVGRGIVEGAYDGCVVSGEKALDKIEATIRKADERR